MLRHTLARDDRVKRFFNRRLQRGKASLPDIPNYLYREFIENPPTSDEWKWVTDNWGLFVMVFKKKSFFESISMGHDDLMGFSALSAIHALRSWREDGGGSKSTLVTCSLFNWLKWHRIKGRVYVCSSPTRRDLSVNPNPVLLGDHEPIIRDLSNQRETPDQTELLDAVQNSFDSLRPRWREVLIRFLGLSGQREKSKVIAESMNITKQRVSQIVNEGLTIIAKEVGYRSLTGARRFGNRPMGRNKLAKGA